MSRSHVAQKAFITQYISIILIILSFMVCASTARHESKELPAAIETEKDQPKAALSPKFLQSEIVLENIFIDSGDSVDLSKLAPFKELIGSHNLDLQIEVKARERVGAKVARLARAMREDGFWKNSYTVTGQNDQAGPETTVKARFVWNQL